MQDTGGNKIFKFCKKINFTHFNMTENSCAVTIFNMQGGWRINLKNIQGAPNKLGMCFSSSFWQENNINDNRFKIGNYLQGDF